MINRVSLKQFCLLFGLSLLVSACVLSPSPILIDNHYQKVIPPRPKGNDVVVNFNSMDVEAFSYNQVRVTKKKSVTVYTKEQAEKYAVIYQDYNKFYSVKSMKGQVYDENMKQVLNLKSEDISDVIGDGNSLYADSRYKIAYLKYAKYPHIIETEIVFESTALINLPTYLPVNLNESLTYGRLTVTYDNNNPIRFNANHIDVESKLDTLENGKQKLTWEFNSVKPFEPIKNYLPTELQIPKIQLATTFFNIEGYKGSFESWKDFGKWFAQLAKNRDELPEELKKLVDVTIQGKDSITDKTKAIYQLMQNQTRYINVSLGIGGWQPFDANYVYRNKYGDCKALTNYTYSMLKYAGVKSYHALATRGDYRVGADESFPNNVFNHDILMVPNEQGNPIWLECTDQNIPFGHIGFDNQGRYALVIKDDGGELMRTHEFTDINNLSKANTRFEINEMGDAQISHNETQFGNYQDYFRRRLYKLTTKELEEFITNYYGFSKADVNKINFDQIGNRSDSSFFEFDAKVRNYATRSGKRLFIPLNTLAKWSKTVPDLKDRKVDIIYWETSKDIAESIYVLPKNVTIEMLPKNELVESEFGSYQISVQKDDDGKIRVQRSINSDKLVIQPEKFEAFKSFIKRIDQLESQRIVLVVL